MGKEKDAMTSFPDSRLRRLRGSEPMRNMARETRLTAKEFIYPAPARAASWSPD